MNLLRLIEYLRARTGILLRLGVIILTLLVLVDVIPGFVDKSEAHTAAERIPGFWAFFGLAGCALLILLAKWLGDLGIQQREDYYDD